MRKFQAALFAAAIGLGMGPAFADGTNPNNPNDPNYRQGQNGQVGANGQVGTNGELGNRAKGAECAERDARKGEIKEGVLKLSIEDVRAGQQALSQKGYVVPKADGTMNSETKSALKSFQKANNLKDTEEFDVPTLNALGFDAAIFVASTVKGSDYAREEMRRIEQGGTANGKGASDRTVGGATTPGSGERQVGGQVGVGTGSGDRNTAGVNGNGSTTTPGNGVTPGSNGVTDRERNQGTTELPAGMPIDVNAQGHEAGMQQKEQIGYIVLGESQIKSIQKRLKEEKYFSGDANGEITNEFIVALRTFQTAKGIHTQSFIDFQTLAAIPEAKIKVDLTKKMEDGTKETKETKDKAGDTYRH